jgi:hypothetical protein
MLDTNASRNYFIDYEKLEAFLSAEILAKKIQPCKIVYHYFTIMTVPFCIGSSLFSLIK